MDNEVCVVEGLDWLMVPFWLLVWIGEMDNEVCVVVLLGGLHSFWM